MALSDRGTDEPGNVENCLMVVAEVFDQGARVMFELRLLFSVVTWPMEEGER